MKSIAIAAATAFVGILGIQSVSATTQNVNNVNDPINHPYQESNSSACGTSICNITFGTIAAPETVVQHVSCFFNTASGTIVDNVELYDATITNNANYLPVSSNGTDGGYNYYAMNENTQLFLTKGGQPNVFIVASGNINSLTCTLSGYHR